MDTRKKRSKRYTHVGVLRRECKRIADIRKVQVWRSGKKQKRMERVVVPHATAPQIRQHLIALRNQRLARLNLKTHAQRKKAKSEHQVPSVRSIQRHLKKMNMGARVRPKVPFTPENMAARLAFCKNKDFHVKKYVKRIHFSDEHYVTSNDNSNRIMWVSSKKDLVPREVKSKHNVYNAQLWAMIGYNYKSPLIWCEFEEEVEYFDKRSKTTKSKTVLKTRLNGDLYIDNVLKNEHINKRLKKPGTIFMQDGASSHKCKKTKEWLTKEQIDYITNWPSHSPDLNPIEQLWKILNERITMRSDIVPSSVEELKKRAEDEWRAIPMSLINNLVMSFLTKCERVVKNKGGSAKR